MAMMRDSANKTEGRASVDASWSTHWWSVVDAGHDAVVLRHCDAEQPYVWHWLNRVGLRGALDASGEKPHMSLKKHSLIDTTCQPGRCVL